jgi:hypothetical protein
MPTLQYVIDSICASVTVECVYKMIEALLDQGPFNVAELLPLVQTKDRSLDQGSAGMIARAALADMAQRGEIKIEGDNVLPGTGS